MCTVGSDDVFPENQNFYQDEHLRLPDATLVGLPQNKQLHLKAKLAFDLKGLLTWSHLTLELFEMFLL